MDTTAQRQLAKLLAQLRRDGRAQSGLDPHLVPPDKATAYRIAGMVAAGQEVTLSANGKLRRKGTAATALDHPMVPLTWLANELSRTRVRMNAGQMVSTGTLTGMLAPKAGEDFIADFGPFGSVLVDIA